MQAALRSVRASTEMHARRAALRLNQAYTLLTASQFQGYCRDLHDESLMVMVQHIAMGRTRLEPILRKQFESNRKLDFGNPNPGNIVNDFGRFDVKFWDEVYAIDPKAKDLARELEELLLWRNALAHADFRNAQVGTTMYLRLKCVRRWRQVCNRLVRYFDTVMTAHLQSITGSQPW